MQEECGDYRRYAVSGTPDEAGRQMSAHYRGTDGPRLAGLSAEQVDFARACAAEVERVHPPILQEVSAWADACGLPLDEALFYLSVGMTETSRRGRGRRNPPPDQDPEARGCSTVGVMTGDSPVIGRNFDLYYKVSVRHLITTAVTGWLSHAGMFDGLVAGRTDGLNSAGLFVSLHTVRAKPPDRRKPGLFCVHLVRALLETCATAKEAADKLRAMPHLSPFNYFLADKSHMLVVECHPERTRVREPQGGVLACANHFAHPEMADLLYAVPPGSVARMAFLERGARELLETDSLGGHDDLDRHRGSHTHGATGRSASLEAGLACLMGDHTVPVCGHSETMATLWSVIARPASLEASYCLGAPCRNPYSCAVSLVRPLPATTVRH